MNKTIKNFLESHVKDLENEDFTALYNHLTVESRLRVLLVAELSKTLVEAGINPLEYMEKVPDYFAYLCPPDSFLDRRLILPKTITSIGSCAFAFTSLSSVDLSNVEVINSEAFFHTYLTNIVLPAKAIISAKAFANCEDLRSVTLGEDDSIFNEVFKDCTRLSQVVVPATINLAGDNIFSGCSSLKILTFKGTRKKEGMDVIPSRGSIPASYKHSVSSQISKLLFYSDLSYKAFQSPCSISSLESSMNFLVLLDIDNITTHSKYYQIHPLI